MTEYCTEIDIKNRLTESGYDHAANRSGKGKVTIEDVAAFITPAIQRAGTEIDEIVAQAMPVGVARGQAASTCPWLKFKAIDIATWFVTTNGGRTAPPAIEEAYEKTLSKLAAIDHNVNKIPGLVYPQPTYSDSFTAVVPRHRNLKP